MKKTSDANSIHAKSIRSYRARRTYIEKNKHEQRIAQAREVKIEFVILILKERKQIRLIITFASLAAVHYI